MRAIGRVIVATIGIVLGVPVAVAVFLGVAGSVAVPAVFVGAAVVALVGVVGGGAALATRGLAHARAIALAVTVGVVLIAGVVAGLTALRPLDDPRTAETPLPGLQYWNLPTGSRLTYIRVPAVGTAKATPIIYLHGGPGAPELSGDAPYFGQLAQDGYDVYLYEQVGGGLANRLADPAGYTIARHVADLDAVRQQIGAEKVILIGQSWGGVLAGDYLAAHPEHVAKVIFSSPGALYTPAINGPSGDITRRLTPEQRSRAQAVLLRPRVLVVEALLQANPRAAHAFAGDAEMDAMIDGFLSRAAPAAFCDVTAPHDLPTHGTGFYANAETGADLFRTDDPRPMLATNHTPALVLKGECDYVPWEATYQYKATLPDAQLVYFRGAGHKIYYDQPQEYLAEVRAFLADAPLPLPPYTGDTPPAVSM